MFTDSWLTYSAMALCIASVLSCFSVSHWHPKFWNPTTCEVACQAVFCVTSEHATEFVRYVVKGQIKVRFLDVRKVDESGATASSLFAMFKSVAEQFVCDVQIRCWGTTWLLQQPMRLQWKGDTILCRKSWKRKLELWYLYIVMRTAQLWPAAILSQICMLYENAKGSVMLFDRWDRVAWRCIRLLQRQNVGGCSACAK